MEWCTTMTMSFRNSVAKQAAEHMKTAMVANYSESYQKQYAKNVAEDFCDVLDSLAELDDLDGNKIHIFDMYEGAFMPRDTVDVMKKVLAYVANQMPEEKFVCEIECSGTYDECFIEAVYDSDGILRYEYTYNDVCWDELECPECGADFFVEEIHDDGYYACPECGTTVKNDATYESRELEIPIPDYFKGALIEKQEDVV